MASKSILIKSRTKEWEAGMRDVIRKLNVIIGVNGNIIESVFLRSLFVAKKNINIQMNVIVEPNLI